MIGNQATTAISVTSGSPPEQRDPDVPYQAVIADMTGYREPPKEDDDSVPEDQMRRFAAVEVTPSNYDDMLPVWGAHFKATLPDLLTGDPDSTLSIDVTFKQRTKFWPGELDDVPEIKAVLERIRHIERLQAHLARQPAVRERLARMILDAVGPKALTAPPSAN